MSQQDGPDWTMIGGSIAAVATAVGAIWAGMSGAFRQRKTEQEVRQEKREIAVTAHTEQTLESVWRLVNELQEERNRAVDQAAAHEARCISRTQTLEGRVAGLEAKNILLEGELRAAKDNVSELERKLRKFETNGGLTHDTF